MYVYICTLCYSLSVCWWQMCVGALVRRAGIFAGGGQMEKSKTCFEKAMAIDSNAVDIYIHRARVSETSRHTNTKCHCTCSFVRWFQFTALCGLSFRVISPWSFPLHTHTHTHTHTHIHHKIILETAEGPDQLSKCINDLERAIKMAPNSAHAAYSLASAYHRLAGMTQSMQVLETARTKFEENRGKFPNFADGLILHALVS